jgi:flagellar motor switch protein FliM
MPRAAAQSGIPTPYDFRRPNKFSREHVRALQIASETFARRCGTVLSATLRSTAYVVAAGVNQLTYDEYIRDTPNPAYLAVLSLPPLDGLSLLQVPLPVVYAAVEQLTGGPGTGEAPERPLTDIEDGLVRKLMKQAVGEFAYAFENLAHFKVELVAQESNPQVVQIAPATEMIVTIAFDMKIGAHEGQATLAIPFASLQPALDQLTDERSRDVRKPEDPHLVRSAVGNALGNALIDVQVRFSEVALPSAEIVDLRPGDVLPLHHPTDRPLTVSVGGTDRFVASPGRRGKRVACVIVDPARRPGSAEGFAQ